LYNNSALYILQLVDRAAQEVFSIVCSLCANLDGYMLGIVRVDGSSTIARTVFLYIRDCQDGIPLHLWAAMRKGTLSRKNCNWNICASSVSTENTNRVNPLYCRNRLSTLDSTVMSNIKLKRLLEVPERAA